MFLPFSLTRNVGLLLPRKLDKLVVLKNNWRLGDFQSQGCLSDCLKYVVIKD